MLDKIAHLIKGKNAESAAAAFLKKQGLKIIAKNKVYKSGEIDIIAEDKQSLVFVEVKYRSNSAYGTAAEMVNPKKQLKLQKAALAWMQENDPGMQKPCRFDVIAISGNNHSDKTVSAATAPDENPDHPYHNMEWIKNAF